MSIAPETREKVIFSISFLTILLTISISGYKDLLCNINLSLIFIPFSLFDLLFWSSVLLFISIYFSALYNCNEIEIKIPKIMLKIPKMEVFKGFEKIADLFYIVAIFILPIMFALSYFLSFCLYLLLEILDSLQLILTIAGIEQAKRHAENPTGTPLAQELGRLGDKVAYSAVIAKELGPYIIITSLFLIALFMFKDTIQTILRERKK